ncbi:MAG: IMP 5'-nucleotidase [Alyxoria varia]|nr:MAG: IMP 5'-nucleotidase [Alyxoria varia]
MTTRYRVEYALKTHRRDQFIEWIKGLLAVPFVLHSQPTTVFEDTEEDAATVNTAVRRYGEIMLDVEALITDHLSNASNRSKLKLLVPSVGKFFTPLALHEAFLYQDSKRRISSRRFVAPSFNDVRSILNTAQLIPLVRGGLALLTFDGDLTLYPDGSNLTEDNPVIPRIINLMRLGVCIGIVTAAAYTSPTGYYQRLAGLLDAIYSDDGLSDMRKKNLIVMGGETNYLFRFESPSPSRLVEVPRGDWTLSEMRNWTEEDIDELLTVAEGALKDCVRNMHLKARFLRKERAAGIIPQGNSKFTREQLEETVLVTQKILETSEVGRRLPFCAFNGGNDVFVDIGDKALGVLACQQYFGGIAGSKTLHIGDQFLSAGSNDFKAREVSTTCWIASPEETVQLLDEYSEFYAQRKERIK